MVDQETQEIEVIDEKIIAPAPVEEIKPSQTTVVVNQVTGIKQTVTNNVEQIKKS